ncbi:MAG TPA: hypothetical protein VN847_10600 [Streptosporangiaceae bacterium]|nr:hypothetical protein [Streptosporangiaceae bacterium]
MKQSRDKVVDLMRRTGHTRVADLAEKELPDPVDFEQVIEFATRHGITRDDLISQMGGSP